MTVRFRFLGGLAIAAVPLVGTTVQAAPIYDPASNRTYVKDTALRTWNEAHTAAVAQGGNLARVRNAIANEAVRAVSNGGAWIGASDQAVEGEWRWSNNNDQFWQGLAANNATTPGMPVGGLYTNWNAGEPNDSNGEDFAEIVGGGGWNDLPASFTRTSVVELPGNRAAQVFNNTNYTLITASTWTEAQSRARALGGNLVRIDSAAENAFLAGLLDETGDVSAWIGASDETTEGEWRWADNGDQFWQGLAANNATPGSPVGGRYSNWNAGEPNDVNGEDFAEILSNGLWNDLPSTFTRIGIVESPIPEPGSAGLVAVAAAGLLARRRRRS